VVVDALLEVPRCYTSTERKQLRQLLVSPDIFVSVSVHRTECLSLLET